MRTDQNKSKQEWILKTLDCYEGRLIQYASRIVGNTELAQDVVQDTFLQLWKENRAKIESYLEQWLYTVCRNRAFDLKKKEKRMFSLQPDIDFADDGGNSPTADIERHEEEVGILGVINSLPANQKEVICLKFQDGLSYKEISKVTGLSVSNVGFLMHKGVKSMRALLKKQDNDSISERGVRCLAR